MQVSGLFFHTRTCLLCEKTYLKLNALQPSFSLLSVHGSRKYLGIIISSCHVLNDTSYFNLWSVTSIFLNSTFVNTTIKHVRWYAASLKLVSIQHDRRIKIHVRRYSTLQVWYGDKEKVFIPLCNQGSQRTTTKLCKYAKEEFEFFVDFL